MSRASAEIHSAFGATKKGWKGPSKPMPIRILRSHNQHGHINIVMNPTLDEGWCYVEEAHDVSVKDLMTALKAMGVVKSYRLPKKTKRYDCDKSRSNILVSNGRPVDSGTFDREQDKRYRSNVVELYRRLKPLRAPWACQKPVFLGVNRIKNVETLKDCGRCGVCRKRRHA